MVPTTSVPISGLWKYTMHAAAGLLVAATAFSFTATATNAGEFEPTLWDASSRVDTVTAGSGPTTYNYTLHNTSMFGLGDAGEPRIVDWELPYFPDANITNITSPTGWTYAIETVGVPPMTPTGWGEVASWQDPGDPFYQGPGSPFNDPNLQVIHWYLIGWAADNNNLTGSLAPGAALAGFSIDSPFGTAVDAPYQASWAFLPVISGDPPLPNNQGFGLPGSPTLLQVPEPGILALFGVGLAGLALTRRRRKA